jgi:hypothetical protein
MALHRPYEDAALSVPYRRLEISNARFRTD